MQKWKEVLFVLIPTLLFIVVLTITDGVELAFGLAIQAIPMTIVTGLIGSLILKNKKKYVYFSASVFSLVYIVIS